MKQDEIRINVEEKIKNPSALTQKQGEIIYQEIVHWFEKDRIVILDFSNIESMIAPFLNNAIGQLYGKYTSRYIKDHLRLENFLPMKIALLNQVIRNAKKFYQKRK